MFHDFISSNRDELISRTRAKVSAELRLETTAVPFSPTAIGASAAKHGRDLLAMRLLR